MAENLNLTQQEIIKLKEFHQHHFSNRPVPELVASVHEHAEDVSHQVQQDQWQECEEEQQQLDDDLGFYPDGVRRTLTDEQISMFRNSEIQRLLQKRRRQREREEEARLEHQMDSRPQHDELTQLSGKTQNRQAQTRFDNDETVHGRETVDKLLYDDEEAAAAAAAAVKRPINGEPTPTGTFLWPKLG